MEKLNIGSADLRVTIKLTGAEMVSIVDVRDGCEHLWQADPKFWGRHAPILFPTVGESKDGAITVDGTSFPMGRHGFARFRDFELVSKDDASATLRLVSDHITRQSYPFDFVFETSYHVKGATIEQRFHVKNTGNVPLAFQLGGHPAFAVPCGNGGDHADHSIVLGTKGNYTRHLLTSGGLFSGEVRPFMFDTDRFSLSHELFKEDALVFKNAGISEAALVNNVTGKQVKMRFDGFPHLGIWSVPGASYVCIEPWIGCADDADGTNDIFLKDSAVKLDPDESFNTSFSITIGHR
jgi:galactose mutarotase-like enzyme